MGNEYNSITPTRRAVVRAAGAGAATWVGLTVSVTGTTAQNEPDDDALLVLIYDDSPREDYTETFPVHQEYDVPGCVAVCPGLMGESPQWLDPGRLGEMHEAGWEVMSHTMYHRSLGEIPVRSDIEAGDTEIHVQSNLHGRFEGDPLLIYGPEGETTATVAGRDEVGDEQRLVLEEPIEESFEAGDGFRTWVRYTDEFTEQILEETKTQIEEWGFGPVTAYVHTYDRYDGYVSDVVSDYYHAVPNRHKGPFNPAYAPDPFELSRANFEEGEEEFDELEAVMDTIANEPDFGILYGHSHHEGMTEIRIAETIELAQERDIRIVTLQQALVELGIWADETGQLAEQDDDDDTTDDDMDDDADDEAVVDDDDEDDEAVNDDDHAENDDTIVGFGAASAVAGLAGAGYFLSRRRSGRKGDD